MPTRREHLWLGNHPALDLVNTVHVVGGERVDLLDDVDALATWAVEAGLLEDDALAPTGRAARSSLAFVRRLRDALRDALGADTLEPARIDHLNEVLRDAPAVLRVDLSPGSPEVALAATQGRAAQLRLDVAAAAVDLFQHDLDRVRRCDGAACELMFLDLSKSGRRRWCDMATCGNRAKAAAHHARTKGARPRA